MTNEEIKKALKLLLNAWEIGGKEAVETLLATKSKPSQQHNGEKSHAESV